LNLGKEGEERADEMEDTEALASSSSSSHGGISAGNRFKEEIRGNGEGAISVQGTDIMAVLRSIALCLLPFSVCRACRSRVLLCAVGHAKP
jgi:hypothetical protein